MKQQQEPTPEKKPSSKARVWLKRIGIAGFLFFLIKGLVWIVIFLFAAKSCG